MRIPVVALVGRPNVGKSTIFNRLVGKKVSIIEDTPGVTRDRIYGIAHHEDYRFHLIDTGGIDSSEEVFNNEIKMQAELAVDEADVVVFVVDGKEGITANDRIVRDMLIKSNKRTIIAINKVDSKESRNNLYDFYELGFDTYMEVSGEQNIGIYELLEEICRDFSSVPEEEYDDTTIKFSVIGRPNVGKSSLVNALLNEDRVIVSNIAGTTRDAVDLPFTYHGQEFVVIDTAGIRKQGKIYENAEKYSVLRALKAIERSNVVLIVLDGTTGQNALAQAREFKDVTDISGVVLTKMDGTAKGGIAVAIQAELGIPVKYIGVGETIDDLQKFNSDDFVNALFTTEE